MGIPGRAACQHVNVGQLVEAVHYLAGLLLNDRQEHQQVALGDCFSPTYFLDHLPVALDSLKQPLHQSHDALRLLLSQPVVFFCLLQLLAEGLQTLLHFSNELLLLIVGPFRVLLELLAQLGHLVLQLLYLVALQVHKLKHLEVLLLVLSKNPQQLLEVVDLSSCLNLGEVLLM